jgi:hypothetical protein
MYGIFVLRNVYDASAAAEDGDGSSGSEVLSCSPTTTSRVVGGERGLVTIRASLLYMTK